MAAALGADAAWRGLGATRLEGLGTLPGKESSRIEVLASGLAALGFAVGSGLDWLEIESTEGQRNTRSEVTLNPESDHRMVFAFALMGLVRPGVRVADPGCVRKSWPNFWSDLRGPG